MVLPSLMMDTSLPLEMARPLEPVMMSPLAAKVPGTWRPKKSAVLPSSYSKRRLKLSHAFAPIAGTTFAPLAMHLMGILSPIDHDMRSMPWIMNSSGPSPPSST